MLKGFIYSIVVTPSIGAAVALALLLGGVTSTAAQNGDTPQISVTPSQAVANQRISLVGTGFTAGSVIAEAAEGDDQIAGISIGGAAIAWERINDGSPVNVDSGGNWSTSVDLPLTATTTVAGSKTIRATDSEGTTGSTAVIIPPRTVNISPESGRVGSQAVVRGEGFPSMNEDGSSFEVTIVYEAGNNSRSTVATVPDASGRFDVQLRIHPNAGIPSTNSVRVSFKDDSSAAVVNTINHNVPEATMSLSQTSGTPGTTVTISGRGFKDFVPVNRVLIDSLDLTPTPRPLTDVNGEMSLNIVIPVLEVGVYTIEVLAGTATASASFTVHATATPTPSPTATPVPTATPKPAATPTPTPSATLPPQLSGGREPPHVFIGTARLDGIAVSEGTAISAYDGSTLVGATTAMDGGKFSIHTHRSSGPITFTVDRNPANESWPQWTFGKVTRNFGLSASSTNGLDDTPDDLFRRAPDLTVVFTFDNSTKRWYFYDPLVADFSDLERFVEGEIYLFQVSRDTSVLMNGTGRNLSCVAGNCWNQVVW